MPYLPKSNDDGGDAPSRRVALETTVGWHTKIGAFSIPAVLAAGYFLLGRIDDRYERLNEQIGNLQVAVGKLEELRTRVDHLEQEDSQADDRSPRDKGKEEKAVHRDGR